MKNVRQNAPFSGKRLVSIVTVWRRASRGKHKLNYYEFSNEVSELNSQPCAFPDANARVP